MRQDQGMLQEVQTMFEELKGGLQTLQEQFADSMHSQTAHFQKKELYQQEKTQLLEQLSKLHEQDLASKVSSYILCFTNFWLGESKCLICNSGGAIFLLTDC